MFDLPGVCPACCFTSIRLAASRPDAGGRKAGTTVPYADLQFASRVQIVSPRILHIIDSLSPEAGGPPEVVRLLAKGHKAHRADVEILCLDHVREPFLRDLPCPVHALEQKYLGRFAFSPRLWSWLRKNAGQYDGIVMHGIWSFPGLALHFAARRAGARYGVFVHGALDPWFNRRYPFKHLKKWLFWPFQFAVLHHAEAVFFTAATERDLAAKSFWPSAWKAAIVPLGISDPEEAADPRAQIEVFYRGFPKLRGRHYLLFLGRIHEKKGCDLLLDAFAKVAATAPDVDLVIAGPDQMGIQAELAGRTAQSGIADRVHWTGMIGGDFKWGALRACDAFVLPSHQENFGISVVEALAVGRPVLISNQVNIWPDVEADRVGLVDDDTVAGTENLLRRWLLTARAEREAMAARARACFRARYDVNRAADAVSNTFLSNPRHHPAGSSQPTANQSLS